MNFFILTNGRLHTVQRSRVKGGRLELLPTLELNRQQIVFKTQNLIEIYVDETHLIIVNERVPNKRRQTNFIRLSSNEEVRFAMYCAFQKRRRCMSKRAALL